ncbi:MAG: VanZ family protein [Muribaculum sp.]|nr:VanZ family protein [Muribaculum sp.]
MMISNDCGVSERKRQIRLTVVYGALLVFLYVLIFSLSAQDGESSTNLSTKVSAGSAELFNHISRQHWTDKIVGEIAVFFEYPLRKAAHFTEYACMGILVYLLWSQWVSRGRLLWALCTAWVFLSAGLDELHQRFVPGRCGSFQDVCLDTLGGIVGVLVLLSIQGLSRRFRSRHRGRSGAYEGGVE